MIAVFVGNQYPVNTAVFKPRPCNSFKYLLAADAGIYQKSGTVALYQITISAAPAGERAKTQTHAGSPILINMAL